MLHVLHHLCNMTDLFVQLVHWIQTPGVPTAHLRVLDLAHGSIGAIQALLNFVQIRDQTLLLHLLEACLQGFTQRSVDQTHEARHSGRDQEGVFGNAAVAHSAKDAAQQEEEVQRN
eukprot:Skav200036  [mRNA]  locus=scaffold337:60673:66405:- [translate_table: standard]